MNNNVPFVSICILNYNGAQYIKECIESLHGLEYPVDKYEILFIDNASTDNSLEVIKQEFPAIKTITFDRNYGFSEGYNRAIKMVQYEYIVLLNIDTKVTKDWLGELVRIVVTDDSIAACDSKMLFYDHPRLVNHAGGQITLAGFGFDIDFGKEESDEHVPPGPVSACCGGSMLVRKSIFEKVGGFDPDYFMYFEDIDLCWRFWLSGYSVYYNPRSVLYHKYSGIMGSRSHLKVYYTQRNHLFNIIKNLEPLNIIKALLFSVVADILKITKFCLRSEFKSAIFLMKGNMDFISSLTATLRKRHIIQKNRKVTDRELIRMGVIYPVLKSYREYKRIGNLKFKEYRK